MTAYNEWLSGTPVSAPIPTSLYPIATLVTVAAGLVTAGTFIIQGHKTPLLKQLQTAIISSILLGFGAIFASNAAGVYL
ncbi:hypothetical protein BDF20DRAFT_841253 [Mycotypha africana]|uniref:uncharacterized protein n=1 Tax=Mycotypha africana TaxID=64632 RepID=UPI0022FFE71A|nr:uncharacterized protein BDF20DRAFT_841253 [Mycotypha africana]KAI8990866.1 hypothetical protein BDF20DRAFT_841253 [Mycotypha africana]